MSYARLVVPPQQVSLRRVDHLVSGGSDGSSGLNSLWMTNISALFARSIQCLSLNFMVMLSSMNPFTDASVTVLSIAKGSDVAIWLDDF